MSTSKGDDLHNVMANRQLFLSEFDITESQLAEPLQVGRDGVLIVDTPGQYPETDALITTIPGLFLRVLTADCSPILIWSNEDSIVAAVHSGWQGSELNILGQTLNLMKTDLGAKADSLRIALGPALTREKFEVGPEFSDKFAPDYLTPKRESDRFLFDNNAYLRDTAIDFGVPENQVEILPYCSYKDDELFFSHRRDGGTTGRMMSVIGINL